jgi:hypothetical protein
MVKGGSRHRGRAVAGAALAAGLLLTGCPAQDDGEDDGAGIEQEDQQDQNENEQENEQEQGDDG